MWNEMGARWKRGLTCPRTRSCRICRSSASSCRRHRRCSSRVSFGSLLSLSLRCDRRPRRASHYSHTNHSLPVPYKRTTWACHSRKRVHCTFLCHDMRSRSRKKLNGRFVRGRRGVRATHPPSLSARLFSAELRAADGGAAALAARDVTRLRAGAARDVAPRPERAPPPPLAARYATSLFKRGRERRSQPYT